uniref:Syntaxin 10 n=1 Tax=Xenopus tropicalis TaxID=8364 RepID=A0A6I8PRY8_XENTR
KTRLLPFSPLVPLVQKALNTSRGLYQRWCELLQESQVTSAEEFDWTTNELRNSLRSIEWDLEDLEETISILIGQTQCQSLSGNPEILSERRSFVEQTRNSVKEMRDHISSPRSLAFSERKNREVLLGAGQQPINDRFSRLDEEIISGNSRYVEEQQAQQQLIIDGQDAELEMVSGSIRVLKDMSSRIGDELEEQTVMLDDFTHEMDNTRTRVDSVFKRMAKVSHISSDRRQWCVIITLLLALIIILILIFVP